MFLNWKMLRTCRDFVELFKSTLWTEAQPHKISQQHAEIIKVYNVNGKIITMITTFKNKAEYVEYSRLVRMSCRIETLKNRRKTWEEQISHDSIIYLILFLLPFWWPVRNLSHLPLIQYFMCHSSWIFFVMLMILLLQCIAQTRHVNINFSSLFTLFFFRLQLIEHSSSHAKDFFVSDISFHHQLHAFFSKSAN